MGWSWPRLRFGLRTLLVLASLCAVGAWLYTNRPERRRAWRNHQARQTIDRYELSVAGSCDPPGVPAELVAILGDSRLKHWHLVQNVRLLPGDQLVTSGMDGRIRIWNLNSGRQLHELVGTSLVLSGDRKLAFLGSADGSVLCWDVVQAKVLKTLGSSLSVDSVGLAANGDGSRLLVELLQRDRSREIVLWDVRQAQALLRFRPEKPGGGALCLTADGSHFTWQQDQTIQVTQSATGRVLREIGPIVSDGGGRSMLGQLMFSTDESKLFVGSASHAVVVFDWVTGKELERVGYGRESVHSFVVGGPKDQQVILGSQSDLRIFRKFMDQGWILWEVDRTPSRGLGVVDLLGTTIAASTRDGVLLWNQAHDLDEWRLEGGSAAGICHLAFHPDGKHVLTGDSEGMVAAWEVGTWRLVRKWRAQLRAIKTLAIAGHGSRLVTAADDDTAAVWNPLTGDEICVLRGIRRPDGVGISPDGTQIVAGLQNRLFGDEFEIYDAATAASLRTVGPIMFGIESAPAWSADGSRVAFLDMTSSLQVFDTATWTRLAQIGKTHYGGQRVVSFWLSDNRRLVSTNWGKDEIHLLEIGQPNPVLTLNGGSGQADYVAVHPSEEWIAVCGQRMPVQIWHLPTAKLVKAWQLGPPGGVVSQVVFSPDGHYLATVNGNGTAYVLNLDGVLK
jgi:WD40 repeat protein